MSYDEFKEYEGRRYTGMKVGRSHKWNYDPGEWKHDVTRGMKFKIAHKRADTEKWSATPKTQRKRMIEFLEDVIEQLEAHQEDEVKPVAKALKQTKPKVTKGKLTSAKSGIQVGGKRQRAGAK